MFATPFEILLMNLAQELPERALYYIPRSEAYERLKRKTGKDFGYDLDKWNDWGRENEMFLDSRTIRAAVERDRLSNEASADNSNEHSFGGDAASP